MEIKFNNRILPVILAVLLTLMMATGAAVPCEALTAAPQLEATSAVLMDAATGDVLFNKEMDMQQYPASTTKIMTALLAIENLDWDQQITADWQAPSAGGSNLEVQNGETFTTEQLVYGMMLHSANDMAVALAVAVSGSVENFAALMNQRAAEIGCTNTHFVTPNGMPNTEHVTTAHDLALITREAMKNKRFAKVVSTKKYTIPATNMHAAREVKNSNYMLGKKGTVEVDGVERPYKYDGCIGVKTGYTNDAQGCLVEYVRRGNLDLICVVLHSANDMRYPDAIKLLDWGFDNYTTSTAVAKGKSVGVCEVSEGTADTVAAVPESNIEIYAEKTADGLQKAPGKITYKTRGLKKFTAPVKKGAYAGKLEVYRDEQLIGTYRLVTDKAVDKSFIYKVISFFRDR